MEATKKEAKESNSAMVAIQTSDLTDAALDWAVAAAEKKQFNDKRLIKICRHDPTSPTWIDRENGPGTSLYHRFSPSTDGGQGVVIMEREFISTKPESPYWKASLYSDNDFDVFTGIGRTILIAASRCYVASQFGDVVEIPKELYKAIAKLC